MAMILGAPVRKGAQRHVEKQACHPERSAAESKDLHLFLRAGRAEIARGPCMFDLLAGFCLRERAKLAGAAGGMAVLPAAAPLRS